MVEAAASEIAQKAPLYPNGDILRKKLTFNIREVYWGSVPFMKSAPNNKLIIHMIEDQEEKDSVHLKVNVTCFNDLNETMVLSAENIKQLSFQGNDEKVSYENGAPARVGETALVLVKLTPDTRRRMCNELLEHIGRNTAIRDYIYRFEDAPLVLVVGATDIEFKFDDDINIVKNWSMFLKFYYPEVRITLDSYNKDRPEDEGLYDFIRIVMAPMFEEYFANPEAQQFITY